MLCAGSQCFLDTNMLPSLTQKSRVGPPTRGPNVNTFAFWWKIDFSIKNLIEDFRPIRDTMG